MVSFRGKQMQHGKFKEMPEIQVQRATKKNVENLGFRNAKKTCGNNW